MEDPERLAHALVPHLSCRDAVRLAAAVPEASGAVAARKDVATLADFRGPRLLGMFKAVESKAINSMHLRRIRSL